MYFFYTSLISRGVTATSVQRQKVTLLAMIVSPGRKRGDELKVGPYIAGGRRGQLPPPGKLNVFFLT